MWTQHRTQISKVRITELMSSKESCLKVPPLILLNPTWLPSPHLDPESLPRCSRPLRAASKLLPTMAKMSLLLHPLNQLTNPRLTHLTKSPKAPNEKLPQWKVQQGGGSFPNYFTHQCHPIWLTSKATLPYTGVNPDHISGWVQSSKQRIYQCLYNKQCNHQAAQKAQIANYLHHLHIGACIACRLYDKWFWAGNSFVAYIKSQHPGSEAEWY